MVRTTETAPGIFEAILNGSNTTASNLKILKNKMTSNLKNDCNKPSCRLAGFHRKVSIGEKLIKLREMDLRHQSVVLACFLRQISGREGFLSQYHRQKELLYWHKNVHLEMS